jgi:preprotein translocase subunit SecD
MNTRLFSIGFILFSITLVSCGQTKQEKTIAIINKLNLIENQKQNYQYRLDPLKYQATESDSIRIIELEKQLSKDEIEKKISAAFDEVFSDNEINDIYNFIQTSAFDKFLNSEETYQIIASKFENIDKEIEEITNNISYSDESKRVIPHEKKFEPIPVDREDGFYTLVDYDFSNEETDLKLEDKPSLTSKEILKVEKAYSNYNDKPEISIVFTKEGARKFYLLTKDNIGKPIAIVIAKQIVSMPKVSEAIIGGKASISGDFSEKEIEEMIETLKEK